MKTKGMSLLSIQKFATSFGEEAHEAWLSSLPEEAQKAYRWKILPSSWYETDIFYTPAVESLTKQHFKGDADKIGAILGTASAQFALNGVYRTIVEKKEPVEFFKHGTMLMKQYHRPSRLDVNIDADKREALLEMYEFPNPHAVYEGALLYYVIEAMKMIGYPDMKWEIRSRKSQGAECTAFHFSW